MCVRNCVIPIDLTRENETITFDHYQNIELGNRGIQVVRLASLARGVNE